MTSLSTFTEVAALAGDPARAGMLHALLDGRALTASELAHAAGVTPQTASGHLTRMTTAGLLKVEKQGRHRYHRLASPAVARMMEGIMQVTSGLDSTRPRLTVGPKMRLCGQREPATTILQAASVWRSRTGWSEAVTWSSPAMEDWSPTQEWSFSVGSALTSMPF
jgi:DNA-binding transcriptional ArsR family regulator